MPTTLKALRLQQQAQQEARETAFYNLDYFVQALAEHEEEAVRDQNSQMENLYGTFLDAIRGAGRPDKDGKLTITLDLARERR